MTGYRLTLGLLSDIWWIRFHTEFFKSQNEWSNFNGQWRLYVFFYGEIFIIYQGFVFIPLEKWRTSKKLKTSTLKSLS